MPPPGVFFFLFSCTLCFIPTCFFVLIVLHFVFTYNKNTNIHASDRNRTRNPSKRSTSDPRFIPLGHWDRLDSNPKSQQASGHNPTPQTATPPGTAGFELLTIQPVVSRYTDKATRRCHNLHTHPVLASQRKQSVCIRGQAVKEQVLLPPEDEGGTILKIGEPFNQRHNVTSQTTWTLQQN